MAPRNLEHAVLAMMMGSIGTALLPQAAFGLFERFSTFSAVVFNAVLGIYLIKGRFTYDKVDSVKDA